MAREARAAKEAKRRAAAEALETVPQVRQQSSQQLSKFQLIAYMMGGMGVSDLGPELSARGIDFEPAELDVQQLRGAGANASIIEAIRRAPRHYSASSYLDEPAVNLLMQVNQLARQGKAIQGVRVLSALVARNPNCSALYVAVGELFPYGGDWDRMADTYRRVTELDPKLAYAHGQLSLAYYRLKQGPNAITEAKKMVELQPLNADSYKYLGMGHEIAGEYDAALAAFKKALAIDPKYCWVYHDISIVKQKQGDMAGAIQAQLRAVELEPNSSWIADRMGWLYYKSGRYKEALEQYRRAVDLGPGDASYHISLAATLDMLGRNREALEQYNAALEISPNNEQAAAGAVREARILGIAQEPTRTEN